MNVTRKATTVRLPDYMLTDLHNEARRTGVSVSRLIEDTLEESLYRPNAETLAAIEGNLRAQKCLPHLRS